MKNIRIHLKRGCRKRWSRTWPIILFAASFCLACQDESEPKSLGADLGDAHHLDGGSTIVDMTHRGDVRASTNDMHRTTPDMNVPLDSDASVAPAGPWIFVTSEVLSGDSVREANQTCRRLGEAAGLGSAWLAWVSSNARDAADIDFGDGPWYRTDGALVFRNRAAMIEGPEVPINLDENQESLSVSVFTGTSAEGRTTGETCREWRSYYEDDDGTLGHSDRADEGWTADRVTDCGSARNVYCIQDTSEPFNDRLTIVTQWNELMLAAIRSGDARPTISSRRLFIVSVAMYDAWSAYDPSARSFALAAEFKQPEAEHTEDNRAQAVSHAAYHALVDQFEDYEDSNGRFTRLLSTLGYSVDDESTAAEIGRQSARSVLDARIDDGANETNDFAHFRSEKYPVRYRPVNSPNPRLANALGQPEFDPNRWTPLRVPNGVAMDERGIPRVDHDDTRTYFEQNFMTPHWGAVAPFALENGEQFRPPAPPQLGSQGTYVDALGNETTEDEAYRSQFTELLMLSAELTDAQKVASEFWADGPRTESPPGHWNQIAHGISFRDQHSIGQDVQMYFALNAALMDAGIACWDAKRHYDFVRPVTAIHHLYAGQEIQAWAGPGLGVKNMDGRQWRPYQDVRFVTPAFAEYVSGHSTFSFAAARTLALFTESDEFFDGASRTGQDIDGDGEADRLGEHRVPAMSSGYDAIPTEDITLRWATFTEAAEQASYSRRTGGIHIQDGDLHGRRMGQQVANIVFEKCQSMWRGRD